MARFPAPFLFLAALGACGRDEPANEMLPLDPAQTEAPAAGVEAPPPEAPLTAIPPRFRGRWDATVAACAAPASDMRLEVAGETLRFHESVASVAAVRPVAADAVEAVLDFIGEGRSWRETRTLRLGRDGRLIVAGPDEEAVQRVRCPRAAPGGPDWRTSESEEGIALTLARAGGPVITLFCPAGGDELVVNVPGFRPVGSEERMTFGAGPAVATLVADPAGDAARGGVTGRGPVPPELPAILAGREGIAVNYGSQNAGPFGAPPEDAAAALLEGCGV